MKIKGGEAMRNKVRVAAAKLVKFYEEEGVHPSWEHWSKIEERYVNDLFDALLEAGTGRELKGGKDKFERSPSPYDLSHRTKNGCKL